MVKMCIEIKEDKKIETEDLITTGVKMDVKILRVNSTEGERKVADELKTRINCDKNFSVINLSKQKDKNAIEELINKLMFD